MTTEQEKPKPKDETVETPDPEHEHEQEPKPREKTLTQAEVNKLMADQRRQHRQELESLQTEYAEFKKQIEDREKAANEAAAKRVETLRKDLPESIGKLLDKLTPQEQLEWLSDPANIIPRKTIPELPEQRNQQGDAPRAPVII